VTDHDLQPLAVLRHDLHANAPRLGISPESLDGIPPHRGLLTQALDGRLPAVRVNGKWYFRRGKLPEIAQALGLIARPAPSPGGGRRASTTDTVAA
jgi:hypothetical protein